MTTIDLRGFKEAKINSTLSKENGWKLYYPTINGFRLNNINYPRASQAKELLAMFVAKFGKEELVRLAK